MPYTEKQISQQIVDYCKQMSIPIFRHNTGRAAFSSPDGSTRYVAFGEPGYPDYSIIIFHEGLPLIGYIEVKTATGRQRPSQKLFQQWCEQKGICYILARSVEDVIQQLGAYRDLLPHTTF